MLATYKGTCPTCGYDHDTPFMLPAKPDESERERFEKWITRAPYQYRIDRFPDNEGHILAGKYRVIDVRLSWEAWQQALEVR